MYADLNETSKKRLYILPVFNKKKSDKWSIRLLRVCPLILTKWLKHLSNNWLIGFNCITALLWFKWIVNLESQNHQIILFSTTPAALSPYFSIKPNFYRIQKFTNKNVTEMHTVYIIYHKYTKLRFNCQIKQKNAVQYTHSLSSLSLSYSLIILLLLHTLSAQLIY